MDSTLGTRNEAAMYKLLSPLLCNLAAISTVSMCVCPECLGVYVWVYACVCINFITTAQHLRWTLSLIKYDVLPWCPPPVSPPPLSSLWMNSFENLHVIRTHSFYEQLGAAKRGAGNPFFLFFFLAPTPNIHLCATRNFDVFSTVSTWLFTERCTWHFRCCLWFWLAPTGSQPDSPNCCSTVGRTYQWHSTPTNYKLAMDTGAASFWLGLSIQIGEQSVGKAYRLDCNYNWFCITHRNELAIWPAAQSNRNGIASTHHEWRQRDDGEPN